MPDDNKFEKLREIGYRQPLVCAFCVHRQFRPHTIWGECQKHRYQHKKHDGERGVSILQNGTCPDIEVDPGSTNLWQLMAHSEFLDEG